MNTIANEVADAIDGCDCFTLYGGYALRCGEYVRFPVGVKESESMDENGRCKKAVYRYADNSKLIYTYRKQFDNFTLEVL